MLIKTGYPNLLHGCDFYVLIWWIINEFEKSYIQSSDVAELIIFVSHKGITFKLGHSTNLKMIFLEVSMDFKHLAYIKISNTMSNVYTSINTL